MRASYLFFFALFPLSFAVPIGVTKPVQRGLAGIAGAVVQSIENPALTKARLQVVKGLTDTGIALNKVSAQAGSTNNAGVTSLVSQAQSGLAAAKGGVSNIAASIISGATPSKADQKTVAQGILTAESAINGMNNATTTPSPALSNDIAGASTSVEGLKAGGEGVLAASNLSLADLGLSANGTSN